MELTERQRLAQEFYRLPLHQRGDIIRLANELIVEDKLGRTLVFWLCEIMMEKYHGYMDTIAKRLMF